MTRREIDRRLSRALGDAVGEVRTFRKAFWDTGVCDHYLEGDLILFYDDADRLYHLEIHDAAPAHYDDVLLTGRPHGKVVADLRGRGHRVVEGETGCEVPEAGFNLTAVDADDDSLGVESVGVFLRSPAESLIRMSREPGVEAITEHDLVSGEGTGTVRLGQGRWELRERLGPALQSVPSYGGAAQDWYFDHGLILKFGEDERLRTLVISYVGAQGAVRFRDVPLLDRPYAEVVADLAALGVAVEPGELCGRVPEHGFTLSLMGRQNPAMPVSAVVFQQRS
ncbi:hypothetical protein [Actinocorallia populi]|uniref:hypothetical protein n=1 Tax=Actinocorallia populi TaxID=2079200 RepID=UPI000D09405D|nr:hypothetical protein [Actinocorallia populi]